MTRRVKPTPKIGNCNSAQRSYLYSVEDNTSRSSAALAKSKFHRAAQLRVQRAGQSPAEVVHQRRVKNRIWMMMFKRISGLLLLTCFGSSIVWASTRADAVKPLVLQSSDVELPQAPALLDDTSTSPQPLLKAQVVPQDPPQHLQVSVGEALLEQLASPVNNTPAPKRAEFLSQSVSQVIQQGTQVSLNGRLLPVAWQQWQLGTAVRIGISDAAAKQVLGVDLLSTGDLAQQPIQWFSQSQSTPLVLASQQSASVRYLDITDLAKQAGWQVQVENNTLRISTVPAQVTSIRVGSQPWGSRIVIDLNRPTPWQISDRRTEGSITLDAVAPQSLVERFNTPTPESKPNPEPGTRLEDEGTSEATSTPEPDNTPKIRVETGQNQVKLHLNIPADNRLQVFSLPNPYRLVIDLRPDALVEKEILWASGIRWHQKYIKLEDAQFPVVWLEIDPRTSGTVFRPFWSNPETQVGTAPLMQTAQLWQALAAINAGFFNRNNQLPLGAIRRDGRWFSGPILNRGAIAWNDNGQFKFGRFNLKETLVTATGERLPILFLNSGYVQTGIARYTPEWGATYTPLTDNELLVVVQNNQIISQLPGGSAGQTPFPIPADGYLLTLRPNSNLAGALAIGTQVNIEQNTEPADFANYPHILGSGPLLLQNRQIVLDAKAEQFSDAFAQQSAIRSCIGTTATGNLIIAAIHNRIGGPGPSLKETAQLMQLLGAIDALNFDGGSSTGLYLGGQLLDRSPSTAARIHSGFGIFRPSLF